MRKTKLFKSLLVVAALLVGSNAWATVTPYNLTSTESCYVDQGNAGTVYNGATTTPLLTYSCQHRTGDTKNAPVKVNSNGKIVFYKFDLTTLKAASGTLESATVTITLTGSGDGKYISTIYMLGYNGTWSANTFNYSSMSNGSGSVGGTVTDGASFQPLDDTDTYSSGTAFPYDYSKGVKKYLQSAINANADYMTIAVLHNSTREARWSTSASLVANFNTSVATTYTIKFQDSEGNTLKDDAVYDTFEDNEFTASSDDMTSFYSADYSKHYTYASGNDTKTAVATAASNVITLVFDVADNDTYSYAVKTSTGSTIQSGSDYKGKSITYYWPAVLNVGGTLYTTPAVNSQYKASFTLDEDNKEVTVSYTASVSVTNLLYLAEGEDVFTEGTGSSADIRCSMGKGGYASAKTAIVTLPAGTYNLFLSNRCSGTLTGVHNFYLGDAEVPFFSADGNGYNSNRGPQEFIINAPTTVYMLGGSNTNLVDYLYIYGTPTNEIVGAVDYTSGYMAAHHDLTLSQGETATLRFKNYGKTDQFYYNWALRFYNANIDNAYTADNRVNGNTPYTWSDFTYSMTKDDADMNWDDFKADMVNATVDMTVEYDATGHFFINATAVGVNHTYTYTFTFNNTITGDLTLQLGVDHNWLEILSSSKSVTSVPGTIPSSGYGSLASAYGLDFSSATVSSGELTAYVVTKTTNEAVTLSSVDEMPANSGVILKGTAGATYSIPVKADAAYAGTNLLSAAVTATDIEANEAYILQSGEFRLVSAASTVPAGKAYLLKSNVPSGARAMKFVFEEDETTGISSMQNSQSTMHHEVYNLNGQRVAQPAKGLYIVDGRKVIVK